VSDAHRDEFGGIDFGIDSDVTVPAGRRMQAWMAAGMIALGLGNNSWAGGANGSNFGLFGFVPGSTVTVDGKTIVEKGALERSLLAAQ
jgi:hypothetical protein